MANEFMGLPVVSSVATPDVFADEATTFELINGTVRITFTSVRMVEPAAPSANQHVVIGRLVLPAGSAQRLALGLYDFLKQRGLDPAALLGEQGSAN